MTKAKTGDIKKYIKGENLKNNGNSPRIFGANGWESTLTEENWNQVLVETISLAEKKKKKAS